MRTADAVSQLAPDQVVFSVNGFCLFYAVMLAAYVGYPVHTMRVGPIPPFAARAGR